MGNIKNLTRLGSLTAGVAPVVYDNLTIKLNGNQLYNVNDAAAKIYASNATDFKNYKTGTTAQEYAYNANGAMTQDLNRGITAIKYNILNLPLQTDIKSPVAEARNFYAYAADGRKLRVTKSWNSNFSTNPVIGTDVNSSALNNTKTTRYVGNLIFENTTAKMLLTDNGYYDFSDSSYYFYSKDYLGNIVATVRVDSIGHSASVVQATHYYPFGLPMAISTGANVQKYKYSGKEFDTEHGLMEYDFGARMYNPQMPSTMTMDPHCESYYFTSPYSWCLNNPVKYIDPDGRDIKINYFDANQKLQQMIYTPNMQYGGDNAFVFAAVGYLNSVYSNGGGEVMDELISSSNSFNMVNQTPVDGNGNTIDALSFRESENGGGDIYAGKLLDSGISDYSKVESTAHELFHGFQYEKGQGGASIFNEVEARVYSGVISSNWAESTNYIGAMSSNGIGNGTAIGNLYESSFNSLLNQGYSKSSFINAVKSFKTGAVGNASGAYNKYPLMTKSLMTPLLRDYFPKRR
jgi:RHS repeat-associated protein